MGMKITALLGLLLLYGVAAEPTPAPIQDRMRTWRLKSRHPDPRYLSLELDFPGVDQVERVFPGRWPMSKWTFLGRGAWRPDPQAQVDELRARLMDLRPKNDLVR